MAVREFREVGPLNTQHDMAFAIRELAQRLSELVREFNGLPEPPSNGEVEEINWSDIEGIPPALNNPVAPAVHTHPFSQITPRPTTRSGYGITDAAPLNHSHDDRYYKRVVGSEGQLFTNIGGDAEWKDPTEIPMNLEADNVAGILPIEHGGTGLDAVGIDGQVATSQGGALVWEDPAGGGGGGGPHKATHQDGGTDEINVTGLSGLLADPQTPLPHDHDDRYYTEPEVDDEKLPLKADAQRGLPSGGDFGDVLMKGSSADYDSAWITPGAVSGAGGSDWDVVIVKSADQDVVNSAVFAPVTELVLPVLTGEVWFIEMLVLYAGDSTGTDFAYQSIYPTASGWDRWLAQTNLSDSGVVVSTGLRRASTVSSNINQLGTDAALTPRVFQHEAFMRFEADGNFTFQFRQQLAAAGTRARVCEGSILRAKKLYPLAPSVVPLTITSVTNDANTFAGGDVHPKVTVNWTADGADPTDLVEVWARRRVPYEDSWFLVDTLTVSALTGTVQGSEAWPSLPLYYFHSEYQIALRLTESDSTPRPGFTSSNPLSWPASCRMMHTTGGDINSITLGAWAAVGNDRFRAAVTYVGPGVGRTPAAYDYGFWMTWGADIDGVVSDNNYSTIAIRTYLADGITLWRWNTHNAADLAIVELDTLAFAGGPYGTGSNVFLRLQISAHQLGYPSTDFATSNTEILP